MLLVILFPFSNKLTQSGFYLHFSMKPAPAGTTSGFHVAKPSGHVSFLISVRLSAACDMIDCFFLLETLSAFGFMVTTLSAFFLPLWLLRHIYFGWFLQSS